MAADTRPAETVRWPLWLALAALVLGCALRLIFPGTIEYKFDERWLFETVRGLLDGSIPWSWTGMVTSTGQHNAGLSVWIFAAAGWISGAETPPELARVIQLANCAALVAFLVLALGMPEPERRERWLWALAFWALNPIEILLERKIWLPSILPLFVVLMIAAWWRRDRAPGAFLCVMLAALMAQVHLAVAFLAAALFLWGSAIDRRIGQPIRLGWAVLGGVIGSLPAIPWVLSFVGESGRHGIEVPRFHFFLRWLLQPFGIGIEYTLGKDRLGEFLSGPIVAGTPTWLAGAAQFVLGVVLVVSLGALVLTLLRRASIRILVLGEDAEGALVRAALWGYGSVLTALTVVGVPSARHYLVMVCPMMMLGAVRMVSTAGRLARPMLAASVVSLALLSVSLMLYIHRAQVIGADDGSGRFGASWAAQQGILPKY